MHSGGNCLWEHSGSLGGLAGTSAALAIDGANLILLAHGGSAKAPLRFRKAGILPVATVHCLNSWLLVGLKLRRGKARTQTD